MRARTTLLWAAAATIAIGVPVMATSVTSVNEAADATAVAVRVVRSGPDVDLVSINNWGPLRDDVRAAAIVAADDAGADWSTGTFASLPMQEVRRGAEVVQRAPSRMSIPMGTTVLPIDTVRVLMGDVAAGAMGDRSIVMSELTASLRGARAGDELDVQASDGSIATLSIGAVVADEITGGTELLMSTEAAELLGVTGERRIVLWGFGDRDAIDEALDDVELFTRRDLKVRRSWDPRNPDSTLGMAQTKAALGEFAYRVVADQVIVDEAWTDANIVRDGPVGRLRLPSGCHEVVRVALEAAMAEIIDAGLDDTINYSDANRFGGCFVPRFNRSAPNSAIGFLSRHTWGMAIDTNTRGSCQGCDPPDFATNPGGCDAVRIFRKHGFAWGGNFTRPDGMHFEWVGEPRDDLVFPSRYCRNEIAPTALLASVGDRPSVRSTIFASDGLVADHA